MSYPVHSLIGHSPAMSSVVDFIAVAARSKANVLIEGESGTGKELVARAIHCNSRRSERPFVAINCAALPEAVLENELFGHEREAFTGAQTMKKGKFELADGGTIFLDEIGEISWTTQAKLLRAVEYGDIQRIGGGVEPIHADLRLIAATNRDMRAAVASGDFREDLYYRLCVLPLGMPPLRERPEDIPVLTRHFIAKCAKDAETDVRDISGDALAVLCSYHWPGNVRQLKHVIDRAAAFAPGDTIRRQELPQVVFESEPSGGPREAASLDEAIFRAKREYVESVMRTGRGDIRKIAEMLGKHPAGLSRLLDSLGLSHLKKRPRNPFRAS